MTVTLTGPNTFLLQRELNDMVTAFVAEHDEMGLERLDGQEATFERLQEAVQGLPFLSDSKLVIIRAGSANKQFAERVASVLEGMPDSTNLILLEPKLDKRLAYYKYLKKTTDYREFAELDTGGLARWLVDETKRQSGTLSSADARWLVERIGPNQQLLAGELEKLLLYDAAITRQSIELLTEPAPQSSVFNLLEAAFAGNAKRALELYAEQRAQRVEPQEIIAMLGWQLRVLVALKLGEGRTADEIGRTAKLSPYVLKKSQATARRLSQARIRRMVDDLLTIDRRLKREPLDADEAVRNYVLELGV